MIVPIILSGGSGTRLWPLSRKQYPKQYLPLVSENTMLQETILRLNGLEQLADPMIVCNADHRFLVAEQCQQIGIKNATILLEPVGRNTAPAIAAAALQASQLFDDAVLLVLSADHLIQDIEVFHQAIKIAIKHANKGMLVTFGVIPTDANTGYGYIRHSTEVNDDASKVEEFVEKPVLEVAQRYLAQGNYLWNSGMFMFQANTLIDELSAYAPDIMHAVKGAVDRASRDLDFIRLDQRMFALSPSDSIDYALMEKSDSVVVVPLEAKWSDIGSWSALCDIGNHDANGNTLIGDVVVNNVNNTYISSSHHMVVAIGLENAVIVDTPDATLVSTKEQAHKVKEIVGQLQSQGREESFDHRKVYRPWGWFDSIEMGENFQVKRLHISPRSKLSLQMHSKRAEHWVVVSGEASVINGDSKFTLCKGESTYIPIGVKHSVENNTDHILEIIEVQSGSYLGEDDIVRFEDIYGRVNS